MKPIGYLALIFLISGCENNSPAPDFTSWEGTWETSSGSTSFTETWTKNDTQTYSGTGTWRENDSISYEEKLSLCYNGKDWIYAAITPDQNNEQAVDFKLSKSSDSTWVFVNPKHDFPNKIVYQLLSPGKMKVDVTGIEKGKPRALSFSLIKKP